jgi:glucose/arabinose dehydrogenase
MKSTAAGRNTVELYRRRLPSLALTTVATLSLVPASHSVGGYRVERIASGLNQPTYITQAPGDPANVVYFSERTRDALPGFDASNEMGRIWKYDVTTRTRTLVLDLDAVFPTRTVTNDTGLQSIAFHPDFNTVGSSGFRKMYVSYSERGSTAVNHVEEFDITAGGTASFNHRVLRYTNGSQNNHTVNWIGFDPTATGAARNHLYISTGDGAFGLSYNSGAVSNGRPSQNPGSVRGKMLRVDISPGMDAYPTNADRNYGIPPTNPAVPAGGLGEMYITGLRNVSRASFDRANGDLYMGDVGENFVEELDFLKAGTNPAAGPPVDYGWPLKEGTQNSTIGGIPSGLDRNANPFTGAPALNPIQQFAHTAGGNAIIGGYVHRGPISELAGKYFYADYVPGRIYQLDFDRNTPTTSFNGNNGNLTEMTLRFNSRVFDPTDPTYVGNSNVADLPGIDHLVSFGEDNAGNFYIVDFGPGTGFSGQYPGAGLGEIFKLVIGSIGGTWNVDANGNWYTVANWTPGGVPGLAGDSATFGNVITAPRTITNEAAQTVSTLTFNSAHSYTINGPGTLTLQGLSPAVVNVSSGTHTIAAPVALPGDLTINTSAPSAEIYFTWSTTNAGDSAVTKLGPGLAQFVSLRAGALTVSEGTVRISQKVEPNSVAGTSVLKDLVIGDGGGDGKLDLTNNSMVIDYTGPVGTLVNDTRLNLLNGRMITSITDATRGLGYGDNAVLGMTSFGGVNVDASSLLVKFTYVGDSNLDGQVDITDLGNLATAWQTSGVWTDGDFDYSSFIDITDLGLLATNWQAGVGEPLKSTGSDPLAFEQAIASLGLPGAPVPEPAAALVLLGLSSSFVTTSRRRGQRPRFS